MGHGKHMGSMKKIKSNQDGGSVTAKDPKAAADQIKSIEKKEGAGKFDDVVLGGNKGDKSKTKQGKKDYEGSGKHHGGMKHYGSMKMGYAQKLGNERMSPGKMGDDAAMKMMHGDAASKSYDGAGKYMNGSPKYIGASKGYGVPKMMMGPADTGHPGGDKPHTHPSMTKTKLGTTGGGSNSSSAETTSGGGTGVSYMSAYEQADKGKYPTFDSFKKAAEDYNKSKVSTSSTEQPKRESTVKNTTIVSPESQVQIQAEGDNFMKNQKSEFDYNKQLENFQISRDSANFVQNRLKNMPAYKAQDPKNIDIISKQAGAKAFRARKNSEFFSPAEAYKIWKSVRDKK